MKSIILSSLLAFLSVLAVAQQEEGKIVGTIKGKVINANTNEPVSYTNIGLEDTFFGTASDEEGNFELKIPQEMVSKNIFFSAVGYKNKQFPVRELLEKEFNIIKIESQSYEIENVDIAARNKILIRILRMASENIPYNYIRGPYNLTGVYSFVKTVDSTTSKKSAEVLIYDRNGYMNPSKKDAYQSLKYTVTSVEPGNAFRFSAGTTNIDELLEIDWVRSATSVLDPDITNGFGLKLEEEPVIDGKECWVISFQQDNPPLTASGDYYSTRIEGKITINKEDYSVLKIEGKVNSLKNNRQGKSLAIGDSNSDFITDVSYIFTIGYENLKPSKIELNKTYVHKGEKVSEKSALEINQVKATNLTELDSRQYYTGEQL
jgi:hypothetical protein